MNRNRRSNLMESLCAALLALALMCGTLPAAAGADEGMWTFDNPPLKQLKERYGFTPTQEWLDHVRLASVRLNDGGSGSFVSANGLVLTNHHVAFGQLQKVSTPEKDYATHGFHAKTQAEELRCPDLELDVLQSMENITARVAGSAREGLSGQEALKARKAETAKIEKESKETTGLESEVVTLYHGGEYWLYRYKRYTDVRLVFAPEQQIAYFGGDPDNFTFPRYDLDFAFFRVYENGKPVESRHFLKWSAQGAAAGELVFISGHPGTTNRLHTLAQLEVQRDHFYPMLLKIFQRRVATLRELSARGPEQARQAANLIFGYENAIKAFTGEYQGLRNPEVMNKKREEEAAFRKRVADNAEWQQRFGDAWEIIARAAKNRAEGLRYQHYRRVRGSRLVPLALAIVQHAAETKKPDGERLDGYHDAQLESLRFQLFSPAPVYADLEEVMVREALAESAETLGADDPYVKAMLGGRAPEEVAREAVRGTKLGDPAVRRQLVEGGEAALAASNDPMIVLARKLDPFTRQTTRWMEENVESLEAVAGEKIGQALFAVYGKSHYPDATFTLRLAFGAVKGYPMNGTIAPPKTTLYGLYDRAHSFDFEPPFQLPERYRNGRDKLDLSTPVNFVSTGDITGGNSGSPVINRNAELVGLIFDGNIESLVGSFVFNEENNRAVAVHSAVILEVLRKLYDAAPLADEIAGASAR